jgi:hypothetical protein
VTFVRTGGDNITAKGKEGDTLLDVIVNNDIDLDGFGKLNIILVLVPKVS